jgi:signal transduction histidine kinase
MPFSQKGKIRSGYSVALVLLLLSYGLILYNTYQLNNQSRDISQSYSFINGLDAINRQVTEAEGSVRGYIISRVDTTLQLYRQAKAELPHAFRRVSRVIAKDEKHLAQLDTLQKLVYDRIQILDWAIEKFRAAGMQVTAEMTGRRLESNNKMDSIRLYVRKMSATAGLSMDERSTAFRSFFQQTRFITIISLLIATLAIVYSFYLYNKENNEKWHAYDKAIRYEAELKENIRKLESINAEIKELRSIEKFAATGRVARTIAHEVRNPLTNISLAAEQLHDKSLSEEESTVLLEMINRNAIRINLLVSDLLNATRFVQLNTHKTEVASLLDDTIALARDRMELHRVKLVKDYSNDPLTVSVDAEKVRIAILNIILNAIEAVEEGKGVITVRSRKEDGKCVVEISDNGRGMNEETMQSLFEPFFTSKPDGNGLGLTNSQNIILSHRGNILVTSEPGKGTTFKVVLDLA